jgi:hypothetical protein
MEADLVPREKFMQGSNRISKHTVLSSGLNEADIRPPALLGEFRRLSIRDSAAFFSDHAALEHVPCPACGEDKPHPAFERQGFAFVACASCRSLYVTPRPAAEDLRRYYAESEASRFRVSQFSEETAAQRRHHQLRTNALWIGQVADAQDLPSQSAYGDVRTFTPALFEEVAGLERFDRLYSIEAQYPAKQATVQAASMESVPPLDAISAFEKLEHQYSPRLFLETLHTHLNPGGLLFLTTRTRDGFDLQLLWDKAPYIFVPEHLNLLSIEGIEQLLQQTGFELVELSTPGQLDVELVLQACTADPSIVLPPFFSELLARRDRLAHADFQAFLQKHRLSSHVRVAARKSLPVT